MTASTAWPERTVSPPPHPARSSPKAATRASLRADNFSSARRHDRSQADRCLFYVRPLDAEVGHHAKAPAFVQAADAGVLQPSDERPQLPALRGEEDQVRVRRRSKRDARNSGD